MNTTAHTETELPRDAFAALTERLRLVQSEIAAECARTGRDARSVKLIAVSKTKPAADIAAASAAGQRQFGENYVQELLSKWNDAALNPLDIDWHFIGHLQSNKVKQIVARVSMIHTVDRLSLAEEISKQAGKVNRQIPVLLEVNISGETTKSGLAPDAVLDAAEKILPLPHLKLSGLMTIASPERECVKREFDEMHALFTRLQTRAGQGISELSMGMSGDFDLAIEAGATMIRIGTAIFGAREKR